MGYSFKIITPLQKDTVEITRSGDFIKGLKTAAQNYRNRKYSVIANFILFNRPA